MAEAAALIQTFNARIFHFAKTLITPCLLLEDRLKIERKQQGGRDGERQSVAKENDK